MLKIAKIRSRIRNQALLSILAVRLVRFCLRKPDTLWDATITARANSNNKGHQVPGIITTIHRWRESGNRFETSCNRVLHPALIVAKNYASVSMSGLSESYEDIKSLQYK